MDRGDGLNIPIQRVPVDELILELQQRPDFEAIRPMVRWLEYGVLSGLLTEQNLRVLGQVIHQVQRNDEEEDRVQDNDQEADNEEEEQADVPVAGIEINPPQVEGPWVHNREEIPAGQIEIHPAQQAEDPIAEEMGNWFWDDEEDESDNESDPESGPDSDSDHSDTDSNNNDTDGNDDDDGRDNVQDASVPLPPSPVPGGSRRRPREEDDDEEEDGAPRKQLKL
ncbi:acidic leucine-rich nuclear phosphoprotein 32-related protein-like [Simochromis diagramma]|uniref:acidic leucine-rich nuclear phosphoprotein 32-related protein-like n=1 Tax=Simochromis diagramma TaxID=43689 RepID=UPI001A7EF3C9|nr:acidic leucine-rich nuclear phosphoprotein 32-related protein-like [Simochromis diagramma]